MQYLSRLVDQRLKLLLNVFGAVLVEGPKWCGKTTTAEMQSHSILRLQDPKDHFLCKTSFCFIEDGDEHAVWMLQR